MNEQYFIKDRADTLLFEMRKFPETAKVALAWYELAKIWSKKNNAKWLFDHLISTYKLEN